MIRRGCLRRAPRSGYARPAKRSPPASGLCRAGRHAIAQTKFRHRACGPPGVGRPRAESARLPRPLARPGCGLPWRESAACDAAPRPSRFNAAARERFAEGFLAAPLRPFATSRAACRRVRSETLPAFGGGSLTPARRAFERPMAMACFAGTAPCLPSRMCSISFPSRASRRARSSFPCRDLLRVDFGSSPLTPAARNTK